MEQTHKTERIDEPQSCEVCGEPADEPYWDAKDEPRACCTSLRCEQRMRERDLEDIMDEQEDDGRDE